MPKPSVDLLPPLPVLCCSDIDVNSSDFWLRDGVLRGLIFFLNFSIFIAFVKALKCFCHQLPGYTFK